jgi:hypothetical protein
MVKMGDAVLWRKERSREWRSGGQTLCVFCGYRVKRWFGEVVDDDGVEKVQDEFNLKTAVGGEVLREAVVAAALCGFVKAHLLVRRTKPRSADAITDPARRPASTAVFRFKLMFAGKSVVVTQFVFEVCKISVEEIGCVGDLQGGLTQKR